MTSCGRAIFSTPPAWAARTSSPLPDWVSYAPMGEGEERPTLQNPEHPDGGGSSTDGSAWSSRTLEEGWGPTVRLGGGGSGGGFPFSLPGAYAADLYLNDALAAELTLLPVEGGPQ
ncbi:MAG: hypothetical protein V8R75_13855 [Oscillospiraceae bacterium]